jgi:hypothetical protein
LRYKGAAQRRKAVKGTPMATAVPLQAAKSVSSGRRVRDYIAASKVAASAAWAGPLDAAYTVAVAQAEAELAAVSAAASSAVQLAGEARGRGQHTPPGREEEWP